MQREGRVKIAQAVVNGQAWELVTRSPAAALRPYVVDLRGVDTWSPLPCTMRRYPLPHAILFIDLGSASALRVTIGHDQIAVISPTAGGFVSGLMETPGVVEYADRLFGLQVCLTPTGARRFLGIPMSELRSTVVSMADVAPAMHRRIAKLLEYAPDWTARFDVVESLLADRILGSPLNTTVVDWSIQRIGASGGAFRVADLTTEMGYSRKHIVSLFHDHVGIPPKLFIRLVRHHSVVRQIAAGGFLDWADLAAVNGFSDQAHLVREIRCLTGFTPSYVSARLSKLLWERRGPDSIGPPAVE